MKKYVSAILIPCLLVQLYGCYSQREISKDQLDEFRDYKIIGITTVEGTSLKFESSNSYPEPIIEDSVLSVWVEELQGKNTFIIKEVKIPISKLKSLSVEKFEVGTTCLISGIALALGVIIWLATLSLEFHWQN